jgi:transcription antitermination factor NusG
MQTSVLDTTVIDAARGECATELALQPAWHVLWTRSNCETLVSGQLTAKGFRVYLPMLAVWCRRGSVRQRHPVPMFPGYVFLHHALDKWSDVEVRKARGLVTILGESWDRRAIVPAPEIEAIRRVTEARLPAMAHRYLREGQRVRIVRGPLEDVEGILVRSKPGKGLLVLSVQLLHHSIAVEVDCTLARPL